MATERCNSQSDKQRNDINSRRSVEVQLDLCEEAEKMAKKSKKSKGKAKQTSKDKYELIRLSEIVRVTARQEINLRPHYVGKVMPDNRIVINKGEQFSIVKQDSTHYYIDIDGVKFRDNFIKGMISQKAFSALVR